MHPNIPRRPAPGQISIRASDQVAPQHPPVLTTPGSSINPQAFNPGEWEDGTEAELAPSLPAAAVAPVAPQPAPPPRPEFVPSSPVSPMATQNDPKVSSSQLTDAAVEAEVNVSGPEQKPLDNVRDAKYVRTPAHPDASYLRVDLPSLCVPYPFKDVHVRPFKVKDLSKLYRAMQEDSFTLLVDALDNTIDVDIRMLTPEDFSFLMYWHRINSYPRSPYTVEWTSKYGNKNKHTVSATNLDIQLLDLPQDEYDAYYDYGLRMPTVRDLEVMKMEKLRPDQEYLWGRAQYLEGNTVDEKLERLDSFPDLSIEEVIAEFRSRIGHGVKESVTVIDGKFDPKTAPKALREQAQKIKTFLEHEGGNNVVMAAAAHLIARYEEYEAEAIEIEKATEAGQPYAPKEEEITLTLNAMRFFPFNK